MRTFATILSAAVVSGLGVYAAFSALRWIGLLGGMVTMQIDAFVALIVTLTVAAAALALVFRAAFLRSERGTLRRLEERLTRIEDRPEE